MLIGLLPNIVAAETLLNNLAEAEFDLRTVSIVMRDTDRRAAVAGENGPLKEIAPDRLAEYLTHLGLSAHQAAIYASAVQQDQVFIAIDVPESLITTAREMLYDHAAHHIQGVPSHD